MATPTITSSREPKPTPRPLFTYYPSFIPGSLDKKDKYGFRPLDLCFLLDKVVEINDQGEEEYSSTIETEEDVRALLKEAFNNEHAINLCVNAWKATFGEGQVISRCVEAWKAVSGNDQTVDQRVEAWKATFGNKEVLDLCVSAWEAAFDNEPVVDRCVNRWKELCAATHTSGQSPANDDAQPGETAVGPEVTTIAHLREPQPLLRFHLSFIPDRLINKDEYGFRPHDLCFLLDGIVVINGKGEEEQSSAIETEEDVRTKLMEMFDDEHVVDLCATRWKLYAAAHAAEQLPVNDGPITPPESNDGSNGED